MPAKQQLNNHKTNDLMAKARAMVRARSRLWLELELGYG